MLRLSPRQVAAAAAVAAVTAGGGLAQAADSPYTIPSAPKTTTVAVPVVTIIGGVTRSGAINVSRFSIRAAKGTFLDMQCRGTSCPFRHEQMTLDRRFTRLEALQRKLKPGTRLTLRAARPQELGKFLRYEVRSKKPPKRTDSCLLDGETRDCFKG